MFLSIHFSFSFKEIYLFYEGDGGERTSSYVMGMIDVLIVVSWHRCWLYYNVNVLYSIVRYFVFHFVSMYTLCVASAHMCKVRDRVMAGEGQSYPASCVSFHKIQTTSEKSIWGPRELPLCKWRKIDFIT